MGGPPPWFVPKADQGVAAGVPWTHGLGPELVASKKAPASCPAAMALAWAASRAWTTSLQAALATAAASSALACAAAAAGGGPGPRGGPPKWAGGTMGGRPRIAARRFAPLPLTAWAARLGAQSKMECTRDGAPDQVTEHTSVDGRSAAQDPRT